MNIRTTAAGLTGTLVAALTVLALPANAHGVTNIDKSLFDATPTLTAGSMSISGPTSGELGSTLELTATVLDGTLPTGRDCEPVAVDATLRPTADETYHVVTNGEACGLGIAGEFNLNAYFSKKQVTYTGPAGKKKVVGDGLVAAANHFYGAQASVGFAVR
ncbi:hypothetical protein GON03_04415 [Nocardioides sp. MAH-18]|uniref:Uncharacterized protein n=1 Tax=Nocardioides agri TaxID=2682843 RepID=A0A6L6XNM2_9ACTN|nr:MULTISPECIES: hypothetical protein [unclassified Nocardioides]MBA2953545.1 hypothetical protein [Nocardioides sp. CGMCC 1.13656]MVQ48412.1 hypothetical protein [Nocardioides sp. MAH-18]